MRLFFQRLTQKKLLAMRLSACFLLTFLSVQSFSKGFSQETVSFSVKHKNLRNVISLIQEKTSYKILYNDEVLPDNLEITLSVKDLPVTEALEKALSSTSLFIKVMENKLIVITKSPTQQNVGVKGKVVDEQGNPVKFASITIVGKSGGTTTNEQGEFEINVSNGDQLSISSVGYEGQKVTFVDQSQPLTITLKSVAGSLNDVVVIGYGTAKKKDLTGAIATIKGDDIKKTSVADASGLLQGKAAGVVVQNSGGQPGQAPAIVIRGTGTFGNDQPLYVIDGMIAPSMASLNPNDIASIDVLKDAAAAAIYGSRAANGVVLVTTKAGTSGDVKISFSTKYGIQSPTHKLKFVNARQYADWNNLAHDNDGTARGPLNDTQFNPNIDTDWQDLYLNNAGLTDNNLSISGGGPRARFYLSGQYFDQKGIVVDSRFKKYAFRANSSFTKGKFKLTENLSLSRSLSNPNTYFARERDGTPTMPVYDSTKLGGFAGLEPADAGTPRIINWYGRGILDDNLFTTDQALGNLTMEYEIIKGLKYKINLGINYSTYHAYDFSPAFYMSGSQEANQSIAKLTDGFTRSLSTLVEHTLNYNRSFGGHNIDLLVGYTDQKDNARTSGVNANTFPNNNLRTIDAAVNRLGYGDLQQAALQSLIGRVSYNYESKYLLTATLRRDGSSKFLYPTNTYGNYPSFSVGWRPTEEKFFPQNSFISDLKIRGSYGTLGSQNIGNYLTQSTLNINTDYYFAGGVQSGVGLTNFANPNLRWESSRTTDIGADLAFFQNRLLVTVDYFDKRSYDVLANINIPSYGGAGNSVIKNAATFSNKGFEFSATYNSKPAAGKNGFQYSVTGTFTTIKNRLVDLGNGVSPITGGGFTQEGLTATKTDVGHAVGSFWGYEVLGIYQTQEEITKDNRTDAKVGDFRFSKDPTWLGSPFPKFDYGLTFNATYKNFDFSMFWQGVSGNKLWNAKRVYQYIFDYGSGKVTDVLDVWTPTNTDASLPRPSMTDPANNKRSSSLYVEDGSYFRLKNLTIGYNLPASLLTKARITNARFYLSAQNFITFTKYKGYDPEVGRGGNNVDATNTGNLSGSLFSAGVDQNSYPMPKLISLGIDLTF